MAFDLSSLGTPASEFAVLSESSGGLCAAFSDVRALCKLHRVPDSTLEEYLTALLYNARVADNTVVAV
jgi:hypothetical protein